MAWRRLPRNFFISLPTSCLSARRPLLRPSCRTRANGRRPVLPRTSSDDSSALSGPCPNCRRLTFDQDSLTKPEFILIKAELHGAYNFRNLKPETWATTTCIFQLPGEIHYSQPVSHTHLRAH